MVLSRLSVELFLVKSFEVGLLCIEIINLGEPLALLVDMIVSEISHHFKIICPEVSNFLGVCFILSRDIAFIGLSLSKLLVSCSFEGSSVYNLSVLGFLDNIFLKYGVFLIKSFNGSGVAGFPFLVEHV